MKRTPVKKAVRRAIGAGAAIAAAALLANAPRIYDFANAERPKITWAVNYYKTPHVSQLGKTPKGAILLYRLSQKEREDAKVSSDPSQFKVGIEPVAIFRQGDQYVLQARVSNPQEKGLKLGLKTRGYYTADPPGCPPREYFSPAQYRVPVGTQQYVFIQGDKILKDWLKVEKGKAVIRLDARMDSLEKGGFQSIIFRVPASEELKKILQQSQSYIKPPK